MAEKQTNKERLKDITDSIETGIKELFESDRYRQYLATMSRFHKYSVNNTVLIYMQRPDATLVALAARAPQTLDDLAGISGMGATRLERHGAEVLRVCRSAP